MMLAGFLFLLLLTDGESSYGGCKYRDIVKHFNLTKNNEPLSMPGSDQLATNVTLDVLLYAILDVREKEQQFVSYVWVDMVWHDDYFEWNPDDFCGISRVSLPTKVLWTPDLTIAEMTEKDNAALSPYVAIHSDGEVILRNDMVLVSSCKMQVYKFPFDIQSCSLSFKSVIHNADELTLIQSSSSERITDWSSKLMTQYEWLFINMTFSHKTKDNFGIYQSMVIYTITMKRRSVLYIVNFILPILFFLCLDLASFLISDNGGEKLSFKVTVLLAVTVMQLILNEILPSSSDRIPLIAMYCIGIFGLMMLSLLETILVMYLIEKDSASQDNEAEKDQSLREDCEDKRVNCLRNVNKLIDCASVVHVSPGQTPSELLPVAKEGSASQLTEESRDCEKISDELREVVKTLALLLSTRKEERKTGYWTRMTKIINKVFFVFYIITASVFLVCMFFRWNNA